MSHYNSVKTKLIDPEVILATLATLGMKPQVHDTPVTLQGYLGDEREQMAHIVVLGRTTDFGLNRASNDLGLYREDDGSYTLIVSDYDRRWLTNKFGTHGRSFETVFKQTYGLEVMKKAMPNMTLGPISYAADGSLSAAFEVTVPDQVVAVGI